MNLRPVITRRSRAVLAGVSAALCAATLAGCSGSDSDVASTASLAPASAANNLAQVCPKDVVVQLQWQPQSDMAGVIGLLGPGYTVDTDNKSVTGPLAFDGQDTGVDITLRAGGPAIGFQSVPSAMYADDSINLGLVHGDQLISAATDQRVVGCDPTAAIQSVHHHVGPGEPSRREDHRRHRPQ